MDKKYYSTTESAKILGLSRVAVFKRIRSGTLKAERYGRNYLIPKDQLPHLPHQENDQELTEAEKGLIERGVKKTVKDFGKTLKLLGKE